MDLISILVIVLILVAVFTYVSDPQTSVNPPVLNVVPSKTQKQKKQERSMKNKVETPPTTPSEPVKAPLTPPTIPTPQLVDPPVLDNLGDFPIPPTTSESSSLSPLFKTDLTALNNGLPKSNAIVDEIRTVNPSKGSHYPKYYRKDYLSGNTIGTTELKFAGKMLNESSVSWSDENVSQYPKYYKSDFEGGLTNPGSFFDQNNQYTDLTGPRTDANINDVCYKSKQGEIVCLENDKLQNIPPSLISDVNNCGFLNSIGLLNYSNRINETGEKIMNGGILYDNVQASKPVNETPSVPIQPQVLPCMV